MSVKHQAFAAVVSQRTWDIGLWTLDVGLCLKHVEARTRSPLRIRASTMATYIAVSNQAHIATTLLEPSVLVANLVCVNRGASATSDRADDCALLTTNQSAEYRTTYCAPRSCDFVAVLVPD